MHENRLFTASRDYSVKAWDITQAVAEPTADAAPVRAVAEYHAPRNIVTALATCAHESELLYQGSEDLCIRVWDIRQSSATVPAIHLTGYVYFPLCLDRQQHDGGYLLASGTKGFNSVGCGVMVWDIRKTDKPLVEFKGHSQDVTAVQFSKFRTQGREHLVYSACKDGTFMVWDTNTLQQVGSYRFDGNKLLSCMTVLENEQEKEEEIVIGAMDGSLTVIGVTKDSDEYDIRAIVTTTATVQAD